MLVKNLKVLHMEKPLAIDVVPYFSWMMESDIPNTMQESYQLTIKDTVGNCIYDSGVVESSSNAYIPYKGAKLQSKMRYLWTVFRIITEILRLPHLLLRQVFYQKVTGLQNG